MQRLPNQFQWVTTCFLTVLLVGLFVDLSQAETKTETASPSKDAVNWYSDLETAHQASLKSHKPILIVFDASWCTYCRKLEKDTLSGPQNGQLSQSGL